MARFPAFFMVAFVAAALAWPAAQAEGAEVVYWLHAKGGCDRDNPPVQSIDRNDTEDDIDGCGVVNPTAAAGIPFNEDFPGSDILGFMIGNGSTAHATIYIGTAQPDQFSIDVSFTAGNAACSGTSPEVLVQSAFEAAVEYGKFIVDCEFQGTANETKVPALSITARAHTSIFFGYEDDHKSQIELSVVDETASSPVGNTTAPPAGGDSPSPGLGLVLVGVMVAAMVVLRRRVA